MRILHDRLEGVSAKHGHPGTRIVQKTEQLFFGSQTIPFILLKLRALAVWRFGLSCALL